MHIVALELQNCTSSIKVLFLGINLFLLHVCTTVYTYRMKITKHRKDAASCHRSSRKTTTNGGQRVRIRELCDSSTRKIDCAFPTNERTTIVDRGGAITLFFLLRYDWSLEGRWCGQKLPQRVNNAGMIWYYCTNNTMLFFILMSRFIPQCSHGRTLFTMGVAAMYIR